MVAKSDQAMLAAAYADGLEEEIDGFLQGELDEVADEMEQLCPDCAAQCGLGYTRVGKHLQIVLVYDCPDCAAQFEVVYSEPAKRDEGLRLTLGQRIR